MRTFLFFTLWLASLSLAAQQTSDRPDMFTQVIKERYTLRYPGSWTIDTSKLFGMDILLRSPKSDSLDNFNENMIVFVQNLQGKNYTLAKMGQESEAQIKNMVTDVQIMDSRLDSTTSPPHYIIKYKGRQGKFVLTTIQHYFLKDEVGYALTMTMREGKEQDFLEVAGKIFDSFQFLP